MKLSYDSGRSRISPRIFSKSSNNTLSNQNSTNITNILKNDDLFEDSAFSIITIGCIDVLISMLLLYVAVRRQFKWRAVVFVAAIWGFVMAFLNLIAFGIVVSEHLFIEATMLLTMGILELFFGYVIMSYFHFMTVVIERGLNDVNMSYYADDNTIVTTVPSDVQMDEAVDERPIMDDQDDFPEFGDDGKIPLT